MKALGLFFWVVSLTLLFLCCHFTPAYAGKPSFDCAAANTSVERVICGDAELASLDQDLTRLYQAARLRADPSGRDELQREQRSWLKERNSECAVKANTSVGPDLRACVLRSYTARIAQLKQTPRDNGQAASSSASDSPNQRNDKDATGRTGNVTQTATGEVSGDNREGETASLIASIDCNVLTTTLAPSTSTTIWAQASSDNPASAPFGIPFEDWGRREFKLLVERAHSCGNPIVNSMFNMRADHAIQIQYERASLQANFKDNLTARLERERAEVHQSLVGFAEMQDIDLRLKWLTDLPQVHPDALKDSALATEYQRLLQDTIDAKKTRDQAAAREADARAQADREQQQKVADEPRRQQELLARHLSEIATLGFAPADLKTNLLINLFGNFKAKYSSFEYFIAELLDSGHVSDLKNDSGWFGQQIGLSFKCNEDQAVVTLRFDHTDDGLVVSEAGVNGDIKQLPSDQQVLLAALISQKILYKYPSIIKLSGQLQ